MERILKSYGLSAHLREMPLNKPYDIYHMDYNPNVVYVTINRLKKEGLRFKTRSVRGNKNGPYIKLRVTRLEDSKED